MRKRVVSLLLALMMLVTLLPMPAAAVASKADRAVMEAEALKAIKAHAQKVYQADSDDSAFSDFFVHAFWGRHRDMVLNEKSAMTAALFNSYLVQEGLAKGIAEAISWSQGLNLAKSTTVGRIGWHNFYSNYVFYANQGTSEEKSIHQLNNMVDTKEIYGPNHYPGPRNANDEVIHDNN